MYVAIVLHAAIHTLYFTLLRYSLWSSSSPLVHLGILRYTQIPCGISRHPFFLDTSLSISLARSLHYPRLFGTGISGHHHRSKHHLGSYNRRFVVKLRNGVCDPCLWDPWPPAPESPHVEIWEDEPEELAPGPSVADILPANDGNPPAPD
jgi:hypothetical protein